MKITVIGSHLCPDTLAALNQLTAAGAEVDFKDILSCHADLKAYLNLRENHEIYAEVRGTERLGIPCMICEDGTVTMNLNEVLKK
ncbi:MAG: glutaredoxin [Brotaphodocola sp.]